VQKVREAANRTRCTNNLKQMAIACHAFHDSRGYLPPSRIWDHWATWAVLILPYVEQKSLYDRWDLTLTYYDQPADVRAVQVPLFFCPSRRGPPGQIAKPGDVPDNGVPSSAYYPGAMSDYAGCAGDFRYSGWYDGTNANGAIYTGEVLATTWNGITKWRGRVPLTSITDGTANTLMLGEKQVPPSMVGQSPGDGSIYDGDHEWNFARVAGPGFAIAKGPTDTFNWNWVFGSSHTGVCLFAMADGSVQGLSPEINTTILGRLAVRNDGKVVALP
jgi:hypothetical protein